MKLKISIRTKFLISLMLLLVLLVASILIVIERREEIAIFDEQKKRGVLIAESIAQVNLEPLLFWDVEGVETDLEDRINNKLLYIVIYDRYQKPFAANQLVKNYGHIYHRSRLSGREKPGVYLVREDRLKDQQSKEIIRILEIEMPIFTKGSPTRWGSIKIGISLEDVYQELWNTRLILFIIGLSGLVLGAVGVTFLVRRITGPLKRLAEGTVKISKGDFSQRIEIDSQDEIGDLARNFNQMSRQLEVAKEKMETAQKKLVQAEKLASIGRISASIAHEIRNPLTSVKLNIQKVMESDNLKEIEKDHLNISQEGISQIENFIKELLNFTRVAELNKERFVVQDIIEETLKMMADTIALKRIQVERQYEQNLPEVYVDGDKMRQVFLNILHNACEAVADGGQVKISVIRMSDKRSPRIRVEIADDGCGIPEEDWENIFEPFYTTKASGIGLGLANARKIVEQHQGTIRVKAKQGSGACFEIIIPAEEGG
ncbi:MAG: PAS domain-containing sensor histidine kinase [Candidatus Aminicenantales bacterium]